MKKHIRQIYKAALVLMVPVAFASCKSEGNYQGLEYAPNMYHSVPYEPLTQITDKEAGMWLSNRADGLGEYYNSNPYNEHSINERVPPANTVRRDDDGFLPYRIPADSLDYAAQIMKNPLASSEQVLADGEILYTKFCQPCHGQSGQGDGPVGKVFKGVPAYNKGRVKDVSQGHIFHVITHGKGRMRSHASQLNQKERWAIARYVEKLQQQ
ncbi:c-type cytochrome [Aureibacter tunicatorum]|uniref:Mono/diheme cytochrome c family protein n=1 Tax=Aureibacter tunicatorum TaxID=866807 RepID=A0AAE3XLB5_9BACT|nr:cytochrome c [Aureibacter tunicatorum]MDR6238982.1 mono/diheme cytochrome c family protein [Aureibacter tunicatorum]BDD05092.1 hypothetical protein AUTU_25750 [Aureibacter tunicatorum]